jgi:hypothetical protein
MRGSLLRGSRPITVTTGYLSQVHGTVPAGAHRWNPERT